MTNFLILGLSVLGLILLLQLVMRALKLFSKSTAPFVFIAMFILAVYGYSTAAELSDTFAESDVVNGITAFVSAPVEKVQSLLRGDNDVWQAEVLEAGRNAASHIAGGISSEDPAISRVESGGLGQGSSGSGECDCSCP